MARLFGVCQSYHAERLLFPKSIHVVTPRGFELKAFLFVLAYSVSKAA